MEKNIDAVFLALAKSTDPREWAAEFSEFYKNFDRDLILVWFSRALEAGYAAGKRDERDAVIGMNRWRGF